MVDEGDGEIEMVDECQMRSHPATENFARHFNTFQTCASSQFQPFHGALNRAVQFQSHVCRNCRLPGVNFPHLHYRLNISYCNMA